MQYNYVTSAALDVGLALTSLAIFFFIQLPVNGTMPSWWGVDVINTADYAGGAGAVKLHPPKGEFFGPKVWKW